MATKGPHHFYSKFLNFPGFSMFIHVHSVKNLVPTEKDLTDDNAVEIEELHNKYNQMSWNLHKLVPGHEQASVWYLSVPTYLWVQKNKSDYNR